MRQAGQSDLAVSQSLTSSAQVYRKIARHLLPILVTAYFFGFLDRVNVGFANTDMSKTLGMSAEVFGLGAGLFFIGYCLLEVPSNLALYRFGARTWITRIVVSWGLIVTLLAFIQAEWQFLALRFLLGLAEAGFFPGIIYYLSQWYPAHLRGSILSGFLITVPLAGIIGGPLSGGIMQGMEGVLGLEGWRWLFLVEGAPCFVIAVWLYIGLRDKLEDVAWLTPEEKAAVRAELDGEEAIRKADHAAHNVLEMLKQRVVWLVGAIYFFTALGLYSITFWLPNSIEHLGVKNNFYVGVLTAIPWLVSIMMMMAFSVHSDRTGERRKHLLVAALLAATGFLLAAFVGNLWLLVMSFSLATGGTMTVLTVSWTLPASLLSGQAAAGGIALINSIGALGGFVGPYLIGLITGRTGNSAHGMLVAAVALALAAVILAVFKSLQPAKPAG